MEKRTTLTRIVFLPRRLYYRLNPRRYHQFDSHQSYQIWFDEVYLPCKSEKALLRLMFMWVVVLELMLVIIIMMWTLTKKRLEVLQRIKFNHWGQVAMAEPVDNDSDIHNGNANQTPGRYALPRQFCITVDEAPFLDKNNSSRETEGAILNMFPRVKSLKP